MIRIAFSEEEKRALDYERYHHPHPRVQRKMEALWLKSQQLSHKDICRFAGISKHTLGTYLQDYKKGGINKLKEISFYKPTSVLALHRQTIEHYFREHPPASIKEARAKIQELTGVTRSLTQVRQFLTSLGMRPRKVGMMPAKGDALKQETFKKKELEPRLTEAQAGDRIVYFIDAAHFVLAPFLGYLWSFSRLFVRAPAGRKRLNVLGALNAITHEVITVTNDAYINAQSVCALLRQLAALHVNIPLTLVLDNARYQKCAMVQDLAILLHIELLYLPSYSPNLNLIERLWKFVKKQCLYSKYYADYATFTTAISSCLQHTHDLHKKELDSLLTLRFQTFEKVQIING